MRLFNRSNKSIRKGLVIIPPDLCFALWLRCSAFVKWQCTGNRTENDSDVRLEATAGLIAYTLCLFWTVINITYSTCKGRRNVSWVSECEQNQGSSISRPSVCCRSSALLIITIDITLQSVVGIQIKGYTKLFSTENKTLGTIYFNLLLICPRIRSFIGSMLPNQGSITTYYYWSCMKSQLFFLISLPPYWIHLWTFCHKCTVVYILVYRTLISLRDIIFHLYNLIF